MATYEACSGMMITMIIIIIIIKNIKCSTVWVPFAGVKRQEHEAG